MAATSTCTDPFDVFGGDSDDNDAEDVSSSEAAVASSSASAAAAAAAAAARHLVSQANKRIATAAKVATCTRTPNDCCAEGDHDGNDDDDNDDGPLPSLPSEWPRRPPLYQGPMVVANQDIGGGRGYVASRNLKPGTLLLVEKPILSWPEEQIGKELGLVSILHIVRHADASTIVADMERLHPTVDSVDSYLERRRKRNYDKSYNENTTNQSILNQVDHMMEETARKYSKEEETLRQILDIAAQRKLTRSDGRAVQSSDVFRMLLALRYNGFKTGVYLHFAIFNHDDDPNCIKFAPEEEGNVGSLRGGSEIRAVRTVKKGESLTISYLDPREVSHATRRHHLWDQHRFDIGSEVDSPRIRPFELVCDEFPKSSRDKRPDDVTFRIEQVTQELEEQVSEITDYFAISNFLPDQIERAKAIEVASQELISAAFEQLGKSNCHVLMIRCFRLHLDILEGVLLAATAGAASLTNVQRGGVMCRFIEGARRLLALQLGYLGKDHVDCGRTYNDLAQGISAALIHCPKQLFGLHLESMESFVQCSKEEDRCRKEYERIHSLYPRNTTEIVLLGSPENAAP